MRLKAIIAYDGTRFSGYQIQPDRRTIQGKLEAALTKMHKGKRVKVIASGRTDQGVHALGQVIHFDTNLSIPIQNWRRALNTMLPDDIMVKDIQEAAEDFHARYDAVEKEYHYLIWNDQEKDIFKRNYSHYVPESLNIEAMQQAGRYLLGTHDFSAFCAANSTVKGDKIRTITAIDIGKDNNQIQIRVKGTGFLYNMVRIIVGTLIEIGKGDRTPACIEEIIAGKNRKKAGKTAPPQGLYLWQVMYNKK